MQDGSNLNEKYHWTVLTVYYAIQVGGFCKRWNLTGGDHSNHKIVPRAVAIITPWVRGYGCLLISAPRRLWDTYAFRDKKKKAKPFLVKNSSRSTLIWLSCSKIAEQRQGRETKCLQTRGCQTLGTEFQHKLWESTVFCLLTDRMEAPSRKINYLKISLSAV